MTCEWERLTDRECRAEAVAATVVRGDTYNLCLEHLDEVKRDMRERDARL